MDRIDIKDLARDEIGRMLEGLGEKPYRARQIFRWLYKVGVGSFDEMTNLKVAFRKKLKEKFIITHPILLDSRCSTLDDTTKYLLKLNDGNTIESVFLPESRRSTACLSSQVGCKWGCSFCASSTSGFVRDLSSSEILNQVIFIRSENPSRVITNIVFMGIGEPLDNYDDVMRSIRILNDKDAFDIGARKITISTCGIIPGIERLKREGLQIELSVSLHSANSSARSRLLPINKKYPLNELMKACKDYAAETNRVITFEYVLIKGVNCSRGDAVALARLLKDIKCKVNTISYNQIRSKGYESPSELEVRTFMKVLKDGGINATYRKSRGEDIDAGCGQLRISRL